MDANGGSNRLSREVRKSPLRCVSLLANELGMSVTILMIWSWPADRI